MINSILGKTSILLAQDFFPFKTPKEQIRIVTWNIEFLGARKPRRVPEQRQAIAERIKTFDAAVLVFQEILRPKVLKMIKTSLGPSWKIHASWWQNNAFLYDTKKVEMLSATYLNYYQEKKGTTSIEWPGPWYRKPITGVFRPAKMKSKLFRVIGVHCHWEKSEVRAAEGAWLRDLIETLKESPNEPLDIVLLGDFNGEPGGPPHSLLQETKYLRLLPKRNGDITSVYRKRLDYIYVTSGLITKLEKKSCFVIRPNYYHETLAQFDATYSDHLPVFVDISL
jgi:endonuclease/exonuclease/phosphatase family metal-dependent hydrolase